MMRTRGGVSSIRLPARHRMRPSRQTWFPLLGLQKQRRNQYGARWALGKGIAACGGDWREGFAICDGGLRPGDSDVGFGLRPGCDSGRFSACLWRAHRRRRSPHAHRHQHGSASNLHGSLSRQSRPRRRRSSGDGLRLPVRRSQADRPLQGYPLRHDGCRQRPYRADGKEAGKASDGKGHGR